MPERPAWLAGLDRRDFLFDGHAPPSEEVWDQLDWSAAWVDQGPSLAGNLGPYWHVPRPATGTVHCLYPKLLRSKWLLLVHQAVAESFAQGIAEAQGWSTAEAARVHKELRRAAISIGVMRLTRRRRAKPDA